MPAMGNKPANDTREWTNLDFLLALVEEAGLQLEKVNRSQEDWETIIETKEFGKKTKMEALVRISTHTAYHAGQLGIVVKYGK